MNTLIIVRERLAKNHINAKFMHPVAAQKILFAVADKSGAVEFYVLKLNSIKLYPKN